jgi:hypothetical protein
MATAPGGHGSASYRLLAGQSAEVPIEVAGLSERHNADFVQDVNPLLARLGCNADLPRFQGRQERLQASLRGYDPETVRALTDDLASRRVNVASPDDSLMLLKSVASPTKGRRTVPDSDYYRILRQWISAGKLDMKSPRS